MVAFGMHINVSTVSEFLWRIVTIGLSNDDEIACEIAFPFDDYVTWAGTY